MRTWIAYFTRLSVHYAQVDRHCVNLFCYLRSAEKSCKVLLKSLAGSIWKSQTFSAKVEDNVSIPFSPKNAKYLILFMILHYSMVPWIWFYCSGFSSLFNIKKKVDKQCLNSEMVSIYVTPLPTKETNRSSHSDTKCRRNKSQIWENWK